MTEQQEPLTIVQDAAVAAPEFVLENDPRFSQLSPLQQYFCRWFWVNKERVQFEFNKSWKQMDVGTRFTLRGLMKIVKMDQSTMWKMPIMAVLASSPKQFDSMFELLEAVVQDARAVSESEGEPSDSIAG